MEVADETSALSPSLALPPPASLSLCLCECACKPQFCTSLQILNTPTLVHPNLQAHTYTCACIKQMACQAKRTLFLNDINGGWLCNTMVELRRCQLSTSPTGSARPSPTGESAEPKGEFTKPNGESTEQKDRRSADFHVEVATPSSQHIQASSSVVRTISGSCSVQAHSKAISIRQDEKARGPQQGKFDDQDDNLATPNSGPPSLFWM